MVCCCYCIILRGRMQCRDDLEWPPLIGLRHPASASCLGRHVHLAGRCPNNSSLFPPLAAVVVVALWPCSAEELFYISRLSRSAERSKRIFTGGVVKANDSCNSTVNFSAMPRALPLGELARQRLRGRARCGEGAPLPSAPAGRSHLPQGDGFSGDGKLPGIAQRRPLEG